MPSLPTKLNRRRGSTPKTNLHYDDVWQRTFNVMGLQPLTATNLNNTATTAPIMSATTSSSLVAEGSQGEEKKPMNLLDLPAETIKDILQLASSTDLVALSLVSKKFREYAAKQLYRTFHIVFPDDDDFSEDSPIDGLAGGLDTFVTSEYDYAQYLREVILETLSGGDKGERAYRHYHYNVSCGKFMNTLLLLTLRKAKTLETFKWDIRVELSREVFKALHGIDTLQNLHLRMQIGPSIYQLPPSFAPSSILSNSTPPPPPPGPPLPHITPPNSAPLGPLSLQPIPIYISPPAPTPHYNTNQFSLGSKLASIHRQSKGKPLLPTIRKMPPTISGFKHLKSLVILDMDTLDYVDEIKECIEGSTATLKTLKLSFSESLAKQSRKPPPEVHSDDDSDQEDEFGQVIPLPLPGPSSATDTPGGASKIQKAQEEKKKQEAVLGKIFGIAPEKFKVQATEQIQIDKKPVPLEDPKRTFIRNLAPVAKLLMSTVKEGNEVSAAGQEALDLITKAAKMYMDSVEKKPGAAEKSVLPESAGSSTAKGSPSSSTAPSTNGLVEPQPEPGLFDKLEEKKKKNPIPDPTVSKPEDIDIEEPEVEDAVEDTDDGDIVVYYDSEDKPPAQQDIKKEAGLKQPIVEVVDQSAAPKAESELNILRDRMESLGLANREQLIADHAALRASHADITRDIMVSQEKLQKCLVEFQNKSQAGVLSASDYDSLAEAETGYRRATNRLEGLNKNMEQISEQMDSIKESDYTSVATKMSDYIRSVHGITLHHLAIYLIPIKASVLSRALDLTVLQEITLLNVGQQIPFWTIVARQNSVSPLPLRKIHTDNVTLPFLTFVNQLERVEELFLLERCHKQRVETTALKTTVTIEQIRRIILKRHASTLRVLMIRNDASTEWDLSVKAAMLLCRRARGLEELAVTLGVRTMHSMLQWFSGLESLRVLHVIKFSHDDNCAFAVDQFRKFIVDNVSHNPVIKLEYIAVGTSVERLVRRVPPPPKPVDRKGKGKEKSSTKGKTLAQLALAAHTSWSSTSGVGIANAGLDGLSLTPNPMSWEESDDEDLEIGGKMGLKIETVEGIRFCDVTGVRIFENDVLLGRL